MSRFGVWIERDGLPAFEYRADQREAVEAEWEPIPNPSTRQHWLMLGNRGIRFRATNDGTVALWDERFAGRWLTPMGEGGTGISLVEHEGEIWGSAAPTWPDGTVPVRTFGPGWFEIRMAHRKIELERLITCPENDRPWVLVRVRLRNLRNRPVSLTHVEEWKVSPSFVDVATPPAERGPLAKRLLRFDVSAERGRLTARLQPLPADQSETARLPATAFSGLDLALEPLGELAGEALHDRRLQPTLWFRSSHEIGPGESTDLWFRFGALESFDGGLVPADLLQGRLKDLQTRLPSALLPGIPEAGREIAWHAALLSGGASRDEVIGDHTLNQGSAYSFAMGFNGAARDPLQHALPLVYIEPQLALSVLRNTCSWADRHGDLPYALDGLKRPSRVLFQPSDQNLWALWLAAEYAAATGDLEAFARPLRLHGDPESDPVPLGEQLRRQFAFFSEEVGLGEHGHVRMRNADWNDAAVLLSGVDREVMAAEGESVLNSAFAAWVLPVYAGLCERLGDTPTAASARALGSSLRERVSGEWNGRWFRRAYAPGRGPIGEDDLWLEVQPWAIISGAATDDQARAVLRTIDERLRDGSPLGARIRWPMPESDVMGGRGEGTAGGVWFSINMTLIWAASRTGTPWARDEWQRMTLSAHATVYPDIWEGTLSGPDAYNSPESPRPGHTWGSALLSMQQFPVNNLHSHSQPLLAYLRLLGIEPQPDGSLATGRGGHFESPTFSLDEDGHGRLETTGTVRLRTAHGAVEGRRRLRW